MTYPPAARRRRRGGGGTDDARRAALAAEYAQPLPLGAADEDVLSWSEGRLQAEVISYMTKLAGRLETMYPDDPTARLLWFHDEDPLRNRRGLPDLLVAGPGGQLWAELKRQPTVKDKARLRPEQAMWVGVLTRGGATAVVWRPEDWQSGKIHNDLHRVATPNAAAGRALAASPLAIATEGLHLARCGCVIDAEGRIPVHACDRYGPRHTP